MKISLEWLKELVPIRLSTAALSERLTMGGLEVVGSEKTGGDTILEIEITPNRPDLLSHVGIAREIAALTGVQMKLAFAKRLPMKALSSKKTAPRITLQDKAGCLRYLGWLFDGVQVGPSPSWMKDRLERLGLRPVNNIVDTTNFVLLEMGQPLHAFDYDRLEGGAILVRSAKEGENLVTIDGERHLLKREDLVIADLKGPVALAGVMGG
ncbi:MAG: phenylalanine--tRNA ligase beta subunit-related protein, partial [Candidatus Omnitrophota bacterium]